MTLWTIIPRDPLIFRDGRPFNAEAGARAKSLPFPFPSTTAGSVRTNSGTDPVSGKFDEQQISKLLEKQIRGPLLVELDQDGQITDWLFPAPADALFLKQDDPNEAQQLHLCPLKMPEGVQTNLKELDPVGLPTTSSKGKRHSRAPRYWRRGVFENWLYKPEDKDVTLADIGHNGPEPENRMHVGIDMEKGTGIPGALFQTSGLEFVQREQTENEIYPNLNEVKNLALAVETDAEIKPGLGFLGGERRIAQWRQTEKTLPACPDKVRKTIIAQGACRLFLLTPAYFEQGHLPTWLREQYKVRIIGAAVPRYQVISGWDYKIKKPKPTRRLTPAGSVYFLKIDQDVENFIETVWMHTTSDGEQNRLDGFGLAVMGTWDGNLQAMEDIS